MGVGAAGIEDSVAWLATLAAWLPDENTYFDQAGNGFDAAIVAALVNNC
jgi:hypothetical protein